MASQNAYLSQKSKEIAIEKLKMAAVLQFTLPGVPCIYYGDENGMEGHIDPFCRQCFDWENLNENLIAFYQKLGEIRKNYRTVFRDGDFEVVYIEEGLLMYKRTTETASVYVYANNSSKRYLFDLPEDAKELLTGNILRTQIQIQPNSYGIFICE